MNEITLLHLEILEILSLGLMLGAFGGFIMLTLLYITRKMK